MWDDYKFITTGQGPLPVTQQFLSKQANHSQSEGLSPQASPQTDIFTGSGHRLRMGGTCLHLTKLVDSELMKLQGPATKNTLLLCGDIHEGLRFRKIRWGNYLIDRIQVWSI